MAFSKKPRFRSPTTKSPKSPILSPLSPLSPSPSLSKSPSLSSSHIFKYLKIEPSKNVIQILSIDIMDQMQKSDINRLTYTFQVQNQMYTHDCELTCTTSHSILLVNGKRGSFCFISPREIKTITITIKPIDQILTRLKYKQSKGMKALIIQSVQISAAFAISTQKIDSSQSASLSPPPSSECQHKISFKILWGNGSPSLQRASVSPDTDKKTIPHGIESANKSSPLYSTNVKSLKKYDEKASPTSSPSSSRKIDQQQLHQLSMVLEVQSSNVDQQDEYNNNDCDDDNDQHSPLPPPLLPPPPLPLPLPPPPLPLPSPLPSSSTASSTSTCRRGKDENYSTSKVFQNISPTSRNNSISRVIVETSGSRKVGRYFAKETRKQRKHRMEQYKKRSQIPPGL